MPVPNGNKGLLDGLRRIPARFRKLAVDQLAVFSGPVHAPGLGLYALDYYTGTDDQKMTAALAAVFATPGGTIELAARAHTFANQWSTSYSAGVFTVVRILGAGAIVADAGTGSSSGVTTVSLSYAGSGAARMDFQHAGSIEIAGILFKDSGGSSVPFFQTTNAVPNIHDNGFSGSATGTSCFQDVVVLGGTPGTSQGAGDTKQYTGYAGEIARNSFSGIRRAVLCNPAANSVTIRQNTVDYTCGSNLPMGACIELAGSGSLQCIGVHVYDNCIEENYYPVAIKGAYALGCTFGPNGLFDFTALTLFHHVLDANSQGNRVIMGGQVNSSSVPALLDQAMCNSVDWVSSTAYTLSVEKTLNRAFYVSPGAGHSPFCQAQGDPFLAGEVYGSYAGMGAVQYTTGYPAAQVIAYPGSFVSDGVIYSGSPCITSATAAWNAGDIGVYIRATGITNQTTIQAVYTSAKAPIWYASTAYSLGDILIPVSANGHLYQCTTAGTTSSSAPTWPTSGGTVTDGTAVWTDRGTSVTACLLSAAATATATGVTLFYGRKGAQQAMTMFARHHIIATGSAPSWALGASGQVGSGASISVASGSTDLSQEVTITTGTGSLSGGLLGTGTAALSFFTRSPKVALTPRNAAAAALMAGGMWVTTSSSGWTINCAGTPSPSTAYIFDIISIE